MNYTHSLVIISFLHKQAFNNRPSRVAKTNCLPPALSDARKAASDGDNGDFYLLLSTVEGSADRKLALPSSICSSVKIEVDSWANSFPPCASAFIAEKW